MIVHETKNKEENFRRKKKAKNNFFKENDSFS